MPRRIGPSRAVCSGRGGRDASRLPGAGGLDVAHQRMVRVSYRQERRCAPVGHAAGFTPVCLVISRPVRQAPREPAAVARVLLSMTPGVAHRMSDTPNPMPPVRPAPTGPPQPDRPVVPSGDPGAPDVMREPHVDPPPTDPPVEVPSDKPVQPPSTPHADAGSGRRRVRVAQKPGNRQLRLVPSRRRPRRAPTCVVGEITVGWRAIEVLSHDYEKPWRTRR